MAGAAQAIRKATIAVATDLTRVDPAHGARRVAVRASTTMLVALGILAATGHFPWAVYASFGAFASVYGGRLPERGRWRAQLVVAAVLVSAVVLGAAIATSEARHAIVVPVAGLFAAGVAYAAIRWDWKPPGSLIPTFALGACASVPSEWSTVAAALGVSVATAVLALTLGVLEERFLPATPAVELEETDPEEVGALGARVATAPHPVTPHPVDPRMEAVRTVVAVLVSGTIATVIGIGHPYWAMVAAVAPLSGAILRHRLTRGVHRAVGTALGLFPAFVLLSLPLPVWALVLVIACLQGIAELLVGRNYAVALVFITPLALVVGHAAHPTPVLGVVTDRALETLIGLVVGMSVAYFMHVEPRDVEADQPDPATTDQP